jgi:hypothetical protein
MVCLRTPSFSTFKNEESRLRTRMQLNLLHNYTDCSRMTVLVEWRMRGSRRGRTAETGATIRVGGKAWL